MGGSIANVARGGSPHPRPLPTRGRGARVARAEFIIDVRVVTCSHVSRKGSDPQGLTPLSMAEVAHAGEHHGEAVVVGGGDDLVVAHGAAGLDHGGGAGLGGRQQAVGEGEEGVGRHHRALGQRLRQRRRPWRRPALPARRCGRCRRGSSGRRRCRPWRRPWRRRWRST